MHRLPRDRAPHRAALEITPPRLTPDRLYVQGVGSALDEWLLSRRERTVEL